MSGGTCHRSLTEASFAALTTVAELAMHQGVVEDDVIFGLGGGLVRLLDAGPSAGITLPG